LDRRLPALGEGIFRLSRPLTIFFRPRRSWITTVGGEK
jgi:hypothetical protein